MGWAINATARRDDVGQLLATARRHRPRMNTSHMRIMLVSREHIAKGVTLRVIIDRRDRPIGTIARVMDTGTLTYGNQWWFTVEWLTYLPKRSSYSLRLGDEDLPTFELVTGPVELTRPPMPSRKRDPFKFNPPSPQLSLPFVGDLQRR
jgi:hypothetical protein